MYYGNYVEIIFYIRDDKLGFYLSLFGDDIFRTLDRIESNPAYSTLTRQLRR